MITGAQKTLCALLARALFGVSEPLEEADWRTVMEEAQAQSVTLLALRALMPEEITPEVYQQWEQRANQMLVNNLRVVHNHALLHRWLTEAEIPYVILKGCASASYYPVPEYRQMGDVDFLVSPEDVSRAGAVLSAQGLSDWNEPHECHVVYKGKTMHYELHYALPGMPVGKPGERVKALTADLLEAAKLTENGEMLLPSALHHGIILLLHTCHHLTGEGVGLRHLCDWAVFLNSMEDSAFCELFEEKLKAVGLWQFAKVLTRCCRQYLKCPAGAWADDADAAISDALMEDILAGGNFGKKDQQRINQAYLISNRGKSGVSEGSLLKQFAASMNNVVYTKWKKSKQWKVLLPAGWVWFGAKRAVQIAQGKRPALSGTLLQGAAERRALYSRLNLYQPNDPQ